MSNYITEQRPYKPFLNQSLSFLEDKMKPIQIIITGLLLALMLSSASVVFAAGNNSTLAEAKYAHCAALNASLPMAGNFSGDDIYDPAAFLNPTQFALNVEECLSQAASRNSTAEVLVGVANSGRVELKSVVSPAMSVSYSGDDAYDPAAAVIKTIDADMASVAQYGVNAQANSDNFSGDDDYDPATSIFTR